MSDDRWKPRSGGAQDSEENAFDLFADFTLGQSDEETVKASIPKMPEKEPEPAVIPPAEPEPPIAAEEFVFPQEPLPPQPQLQQEPEPVPEPEEEPEDLDSWKATPMDHVEAAENPEGRKFNKLVRNLILIGVGFLAVVVLVIFGYFEQARRRSRTPREADSSISSESQDETASESKELSGVIEALDAATGAVKIYNALTAETTELSLGKAEITDARGEAIGIEGLHRGQIVDAKFNSGSKKAEQIQLTTKALKISNVNGVSVEDNTVKIGDKSYSIDDHLICTYQGQDYEIRELKKEQVIQAEILDDHLYTLYIIYSTGKLQLANYDAFIGGSLTLKSDAGTESEPVEIVENMQPVTALEGINTVTITKDAATVFTGKVFITNGETKMLTLPATAERTGSVKLVVTPESATITIDGTYYASGETIELSYGQHQLTATADGYSPLEKTITVSQPYQRVLINLTNSTTMVSITSALNGSAVYINGVYQGTAPVRVSLEPGVYMVTLVTPGYEDASMSLNVVPGQLEQVLYFSDFVPVQPEPEPEPQPEPDPSSEEPSDEPSSEEPSDEPSSDEPSDEPSSDEPSDEPSSEEPSDEPSSEEPSEDPSSEEPSSEEPSSEEPSSEEPSEEPSDEPSSEDPGNEDDDSTDSDTFRW